MRKYLLFCLAFCVLGCLAQDLIVRPNDPITVSYTHLTLPTT